jgi:hypothetical protein
MGWRKVKDRSHIPKADKDKLQKLCDLAGYQKEEWSKIYKIARSITPSYHLPPAVTVVRFTDGTYYLETMDAQKSPNYYKSSAFDSLLPLMIDTLGLNIKWTKIR